MGSAEATRTIATNRKACFNYQISERVEAGISLLGTEVKSIRQGGLSFRDSYVDFQNGELFLVVSESAEEVGAGG